MARFPTRSALGLSLCALVSALAPAPQQRAPTDPVETMIRGLLESPKIEAPPAVREPKVLASERLRLALRLREDKLRTLVHLIGDPNENRFGAAFQSATTERLLLWSRRALNARLDLAATPDERRHALAQELVWARKMDGVLKELAKGAGSSLSQADVDQVAFYGLEVEEQLGRERTAEKK